MRFLYEDFEKPPAYDLWEGGLLNVEHFNKIITHIEADRNLLHQDVWMETRRSLEGDGRLDYYGKFSACGTAACFAGWSFILSRSLVPREWLVLAEKPECDFSPHYETVRLGLSRAEADILFIGSCGLEDVDEWDEVKYRIAVLVNCRAAIGERSALQIKLPGYKLEGNRLVIQ